MIILFVYNSSGTSGTSDMELFFEGKSWEEIIEEFLASSPDRPENVGVAYYNTVTGEYHEYHGDRYYLAASMYKLHNLDIEENIIHTYNICKEVFKLR